MWPTPVQVVNEWIIIIGRAIETVPLTGEWVQADGFYLGNQLYKIDGSTCVAIACTASILTVSCCINYLASCVVKLRCPYPVKHGEFSNGPPKEFSPLYPIPPTAAPFL